MRKNVKKESQKRVNEKIFVNRRFENVNVK